MPNIFTTPATTQVTCENGLAPYLATELTALGFTPIRQHRTGVELSATMNDGMRLCLQSRLAYSVLYEVKNFSAGTPEELYAAAVKFPWETVLTPTAEISLTGRINTPRINDTRYPILKLKDAIVDRMRQTCGERPNSNHDKNGAVIHLNWEDDRAWLFINAAGNKLSDRGYRQIPLAAPLRENLAAAILQTAGYDGSQPLVNPMCGSGTLAIEAALIARRAAPGLLRDHYAFMHLRDFDGGAYQTLRQTLNREKRDAGGVGGAGFAPIIASDLSPDAVTAARQNATTAGVENLITFHVGDFTTTPLPTAPGIIIINPPYGERLGETEALAPLYKSIGDWFKQKGRGSVGYVFTGNRELGKKIGLKTERRFEFFNAKIECRLLKFSLY